MKLTVAFPVDVEITRDKAREILEAWDSRRPGQYTNIRVDWNIDAVCDDQDIYFETMNLSSLPLNLHQITRLRELATDVPSEQF